MTTVGKLVFELSLEGNISSQLDDANKGIQNLTKSVAGLKAELEAVAASASKVSTLAVAVKSLAIGEKKRAEALMEVAEAQAAVAKSAERTNRAAKKAQEQISSQAASSKENVNQLSEAYRRAGDEFGRIATIAKRAERSAGKGGGYLGTDPTALRKLGDEYGRAAKIAARSEQKRADEARKASEAVKKAWASGVAGAVKVAQEKAKAIQQQESRLTANILKEAHQRNKEEAAAERQRIASVRQHYRKLADARKKLARFDSMFMFTGGKGVGKTALPTSQIQRLAAAGRTAQKSMSAMGNAMRAAANTGSFVFRKLNKTVSKLGGAVRKVTHNFVRFVLSMSGMVFVGSLAGIIIGRIIRGAIDLTRRLYEAAKAGASFNYIENAFKSLTGVVDESGEALDRYNDKLADAGARVDGFIGGAAGQITDRSAVMLNEMQAATFGMVDNLTLMERWNQAVQLLGDDVAKDLPEVLGLVTKFAAATGREVDHSMESIINGVARMEKRWLDNVGVLFDMNTALDEYAASLGKTRDQLTEFEQRQAVMNKTLEFLHKNLENIADPTGTAVWAFARLEAMGINLKHAFGEDLIPVFVRVVQWLDKMWPLIQAGAQAVAGFVSSVPSLAREFVAGFSSAFDFMKEWFGDADLNSDDWGENIMYQLAKGIIRGIKWVIQALTTAANVITDLLQPGSPPKILPDIDDWGRETAEVWIDGWSESRMDRFKKFASKVAAYWKTFGGDMADSLTLSSRDSLIASITSGKTGVDNLPVEMKAWANAVMNTESATRRLAVAQDRLNDITAKYEKALRPISRELQVIADRQQAVADVQRAFELMQIVEDAGAPPLAKQLALMELRQIQLQNQERGINRVADAEKEAAQEEVDRMEKALDYAERYEKLQEDILDLMLDNQDLLSSMAKGASDAAGAIADALEEVASGLGAPFNFDPPSMSAFAEEIKQLAEKELGPASKKLGEAVGKMVEALKTRITEGLDDEEWRQRLVDVLADVLWNALKSMGEFARSQFTRWWKEKFGPDIEFLAENTSGVIATFLNGAAYLMLQQEEKSQEKRVSLTAEATKRIINSLGRMFRRMVNVVRVGFPDLIAELRTQWELLETKWGIWIDLWHLNWFAAIMRLPAILLESYETISGMGKSLVLWMMEGMGTMWGAWVDYMKSFVINALKLALINSWPKGVPMPQALQDWLGGFGGETPSAKGKYKDEGAPPSGSPSGGGYSSGGDSGGGPGFQNAPAFSNAPASSTMYTRASSAISEAATSVATVPVVVNVANMTGSESDLRKLAARINRVQSTAGK